MKKFLTISMMALAVVFASSCEKDENPADETNTNYVNTWVDENISASQVIGDEFNDILKNLPADAQQQIASQLNTLTFKAAFCLSEGGNGQAGVIVEKTKLNLLSAAVEAMLNQYGSQLPAEALATIQKVLPALKQFVAGLDDNDLVGTSFTWTVTPADATSGDFAVTVKTIDEDNAGAVKEDTETVHYSELTADSITLTVTDEEDGQFTYTFKSASAAKVTLGKFVDVATLASGLVPEK